jgi:hypothetical protein
VVLHQSWLQLSVHLPAWRPQTATAELQFSRSPAAKTAAVRAGQLFSCHLLLLPLRC